MKETGWRKYKFKKFLTRQEQFEEHKFENFSDAQKQAVSDEEDKFENFSDAQKQAVSDKEDKFETSMFLNSKKSKMHVNHSCFAVTWWKFYSVAALRAKQLFFSASEKFFSGW